jgi:GNAT superfamily N-acetyltransferase
VQTARMKEIPGVAIRLATSSDAERLLEPFTWLFAPPGSRPPDWSEEHALPRIGQTIESSSSVILVADDAAAGVVGFATVYLDIVSVRFGQRAWLEDLAVHPAFRSRGIGARLLAAARSWAAEGGATHLELESGEGRVDAHRFYRREDVSLTARCFIWQF